MNKQTIIQGDCLEVMKTFPDKSFDLVLTDPPYGVDLEYDIYKDTFDSWKELMKKFIPEALRVSRGAVLIPTSKFEGEVFIYQNFSPTWRVCWFKGASSTRCPIGFKDWEPTFIFGNPVKQVHDHFSVHAHMARKQVEGHPCPKPIEWGKWFVERFSNENDTILDPFMGSGTTLIATHQLGRNATGIEISPEYCKIAQQRLDATPNPLF